jgi:undecaprenyl-diphosphatase
MYHLTNIFLLSLRQNLHNLDIGILKGIYESRIQALDSACIVITNSAGVVAFGLPILLLFIAYRKKNMLLRRDALTLLITVAISAIIANILKYVFDMPRPYEIYPFIVKLSYGGSPSFPSGHTADAFAFAVAVSLVSRKWYIILPGLIWALLVGYSRMSLGVHFPSDVLGGAVIGAVCAYGYILYAKRKDQISP